MPPGPPAGTPTATPGGSDSRPSGRVFYGSGGTSPPRDLTPPTLNLTQDHPDAFVRWGDTVNVTAEFSERVAASPVISIDVAEGSDADVSASMSGDATVWTFAWQVPEGHDGNATISVSASDLAGNACDGSDLLLFTIDNTPPSLVSFDHADGYPLTDAHLVSAVRSVGINATFDEPVSSAGIIVDVEDGTDADIAADMTGTGTEWTYTWQVPAGHEGNATVSAVGATDRAGNVYAGTDTLGFVIDNTAPVLVSFNHTAGYPFTDNHRVCGSRDVVLNASFDENVTSATIGIDVATGTDADNVTAMAGSGTNWTIAWDVPDGHDNDTVAVTVTGADIAGNTALIDGELHFTIDNTPPVVYCSNNMSDDAYWYDCEEPVYHFGSLWQYSTVNYTWEYEFWMGAGHLHLIDPVPLTPSDNYGLIHTFPAPGTGTLSRGSATGWVYEKYWNGNDIPTFCTYRNVMTDEAGNSLVYDTQTSYRFNVSYPDANTVRFKVIWPDMGPPPVTDA